MNMTDEPVDTLTKQYRRELSAVNSYEQALKKYNGQREEAELRKIYREHLDATLCLRMALQSRGRSIPDGAGTWGSVASSVKRAATIVNDELPLHILRRGESINAEGYDALLSDENLSDGLVIELRGLRGRCRRHITTLGAMIAQVPEARPRPLRPRVHG